MLAAASVALGGAFAVTASAETVEVKGGWAVWGVKESFRTYIGGAGEITLSGGATENEDGTYRFPIASGTLDTETGLGEVQATGSVNFFAHGGALNITVANPRVVLAPTGAKLYADAQSVPMGGGDPINDNRDLVNLDVEAVDPEFGPTTIEWSSIPATLAENGVPVFGRYPAETTMDPVSVVAGFGETPGLKVVGQARLGKRAKAAVAKVRCKTGPCEVAAQKRTKIRVGKRQFKAKVKAPDRVGDGKRAQIVVQVTKRVAKKLAGRKGTVKFDLWVGAGPGAEVDTTVKTTLVGARAR